MIRFILRALAVTATILGSSAQGHEDPRGDVFPTIVTKGGRFEVYFTNNRTPPQKVFRKIISFTGKVIVDREAFEGEVPENEEDFRSYMSIEEGRPSHVYEGGTSFEPRLPSGRYADCYVVGAISREKWIMRDSPEKPGPKDSWPFSLRMLAVPSGEVLASTLIGTPARFSDMAITSGALSTDTEIIIAWMEKRRFPDIYELHGEHWIGPFDNTGLRVVVTRWNPKSGRTLHTVAAPAISDNVSICIARINNVVLVAWHEWGAIRTRMVNLRGSSFVSRLPELRPKPEVSGKVWPEIKRATPKGDRGYLWPNP